MPLWFEIAVLVLLGMIGLMLTGMREAIVDGIRAMDKRLEEITDRLDELCEPERERQRENREIESQIVK